MWQFHGSRGRPAVVESLISGFAAQAVLVISGVLVARALGVADRGELALLVLIPMGLAQFGSLGLPLAVTYFISQDRRRARAIVRSVAVAGSVQAVLLGAFHAVVLVFVVSDRRPEVFFAGILTLPVAPLSLAHQYGLGVLQGLQLFRHFHALRLIPPTLYSVAVIALMAFGAERLLPITAAWVATYAFGAAVLLWIVTTQVPEYAGPIPERFRDLMLRFGLKGFLGSASAVERFRLDQIVVGFALSPAALGLYVVGLAFTNLIGFVGQSIAAVGYPRIASIRELPARRRALWSYFVLAIVCCGLVFVALQAAVAWLVPTVFGSEFGAAVPVARILLIASFLLAARNVLGTLARGAGHPGYATIAEVASWISLLPALVILIPLWGLAGVAWSVVVSSAVSALSLLVLAMTRWRSRYGDKCG